MLELPLRISTPHNNKAESFLPPRKNRLHHFMDVGMIRRKTVSLSYLGESPGSVPAGLDDVAVSDVVAVVVPHVCLCGCPSPHPVFRGRLEDRGQVAALPVVVGGRRPHPRDVKVGPDVTVAVVPP